MLMHCSINAPRWADWSEPRGFTVPPYTLTYALDLEGLLSS